MALVERFPRSVRLVLDSVVLDKMATFHRGLPGYQETVADFRHREVPGSTWLWSWRLINRIDQRMIIIIIITIKKKIYGNTFILFYFAYITAVFIIQSFNNISQSLYNCFILQRDRKIISIADAWNKRIIFLLAQIKINKIHTVRIAVCAK